MQTHWLRIATVGQRRLEQQRRLSLQLEPLTSTLSAAFLLLSIAAVFGSGTPVDAQDQRASTPASQPKAAQQVSIDGEPLPDGVIAQLGTKHFRSNREVVALCYLPDGKTIALTTRDGFVQHWDAATGRLLREKKFTDRELAIDPATASGRLVAVHGIYRDPAQPQPVYWIGLVSPLSASQTLEMKIDDRMARQVAVSGDGKTMAYGGTQAHLVDVDSQSEIATRAAPPQQQIGSLTFSPDGETLAIGGRGQVQLWRWKENKDPTTIDIPHQPQRSPTPVGSVAFSPDGKSVAVGSADTEAQGMLLFDAATGERLRSFGVPEVERWNVRMLQFSPDGNLLAAPIYAANDRGGVAVWEVATGKFVRRLVGQLSGAISALAFSPDARQLAASSMHSGVCVWNVETGELAGADQAGHMQPPSTVRFLPGDQRLVSTGDDGTIRIWNLADSSQVRVIEPVPDKADQTRWIRGMDVSPDGKLIATSSFDDTVRLWELATGRQIFRLQGHGRLGGHRSVRFSADGKQFASWGDDMQVHVWDVATGKAVQDFLAQPAGVQVPDLNKPGGGGALELVRMTMFGAISPDASRAIVFLAGNGYVFDTASGKELSKFDHQGGSGDSAEVSPDGKLLLCSAWGRGQQVQLAGGGVSSNPATNHPVELRNLADGQLLAKLEMDGTGAGPSAFSPDGRLVAVTSVDKQCRCEVRKVPDLAQVSVIDLPSRASAVEFSHSGKLLATSVADGTILVWDLDHLPDRGKP